jgi:hypothetical protein
LKSMRQMHFPANTICCSDHRCDVLGRRGAMNWTINEQLWTIDSTKPQPTVLVMHRSPDVKTLQPVGWSEYQRSCNEHNSKTSACASLIVELATHHEKILRLLSHSGGPLQGMTVPCLDACRNCYLTHPYTFLRHVGVEARGRQALHEHFAP